MKKITTLILLLSFSMLLRAQIPNGDMESWINSGTYQEPTGWATINSASGGLAISVYKDSTDPYDGNYSAEVIPASVFSIGVPGLLLLGAIDPINHSISGGVPFTDRPASLQAYYKYSTTSPDSCFIGAFLTHWNTSTHQRDSVAVTAFISSAQESTYTLISSPFFYLTGETPDSIQVIVSETANFASPPLGTDLKIDDIETTGTTGITPLSNLFGLSYYPNPVRDQLNVVYNQYQNVARIDIFDVMGRRVQSNSSIKGKIIPLNVSQLPSGIFFFSVIGKNGQILKTDKFSKVN
jgi:hypothetical protein